MDLDPATLIIGLLVSTIGFSLFLYGKKQARLPQLAAGLILMVLPVIAPAPLWDGGLAAATIVGLWWIVRRGW